MIELMTLVFLISLLGLLYSLPDPGGYINEIDGHPIIMGVCLLPFVISSSYLSWQLFKLLVRLAI